MENHEIKEYYLNITVGGKKFRFLELQAQSSIPFQNTVNIGDGIIRKGKFIKLADYSQVSFDKIIQHEENWKVKFNEVLDLVLSELILIRDLGGESIKFYLGANYNLQSNIELSTHEIEKLNKMKASFDIKDDYILKCG